MVLQQRSAPRVKGTIKRYADQSGVNSALQVSTVVQSGKAFRLVAVFVIWSALITQTVTVSLDSGLGTAWDLPIQDIPFAAERYGVFIPDQELWFLDDDQIDVDALAGGAGVTSAIIIVTETK